MFTANAGLIGTYHEVDFQARVLDTRHGIGAPARPLGAGQTLTVNVTNFQPVDWTPLTGGIISAIVVNLTETGATRDSFLTVSPAGEARPNVSNLNFRAGTTVANSVTVPVDANGDIDIYNYVGSVQVIVDISGYYFATDYPGGAVLSGSYHALTAPKRVLDTRQNHIGPLPAGDVLTETLDFGNATVNHAIAALAVNVTAVGASAAGYLTVNAGPGRPLTSTLNFAKGATVANYATLNVGPSQQLPEFSLYVSAKTNVIVDVLGYFDNNTLADGLRFHPVAPIRIVDSRSSLGTPGPIGPNTTALINPQNGGFDTLTRALAVNVTAVNPTTSTYLTLWSAGARPTASTLNPPAGQNVANADINPITAGGQFFIYNSLGSTDIVIDLAGRFELYAYALTPATNSVSPAQAVPPIVTITSGAISLRHIGT